MSRTDVAIVGAGPVGLSLALGLVRSGRSVAVLERNDQTSEHSRAPAIWPRTQEILDGLGVIDAFVDRGIVHRRLVIRDADRDRPLVVVPFEALAGETPWPQLLILPQSETEALLAEALRARDGEALRFSCEVTGVEDTGSSVVVRYRDAAGDSKAIEAAFAVGCDGAHSTARASIGAELEGVTYEMRAALADARVAGGLDVSPRLTTRQQLAVGIPIAAQLLRIILPFTATDQRPLETRVARAIEDLLPAGSGPHEIVWQSEFQLHRRSSSRFCRGRVALAGDAAHLNSPVGGQGMNAGIQDAEILTRALCRALDDDTIAPLADYERHRRRLIEGRVNRFTDQLTRLLMLSRGRFIKSAFRATAVAMGVPPLRRRILRRLAMLDQR